MESRLVPSWQETHITSLENPISEFNARGGLDLKHYQAYVSTIQPQVGYNSWEQLQPNIPAVEHIEDLSTGQKLRVQKFNWPESTQALHNNPVTIFNLPFGVPIDLNHLIYQHHLLSMSLNAPLMVLENPSYGQSDKLLPHQAKALKQADFGPIATSMLGIIKTEGVQRINCVGYSMGSDLSASIAAHAAKEGVEVDNLFVMESPRAKPQHSLKLAVNFASDVNNLKFVWQHPIDPVLRHVTSGKFSIPRGLLTYGRALYKGGLQTDLLAALNSQPNLKLTVARAGSSKITSKNGYQQLLAELRSQFPDRIIREIVMPGESHAFGDSGSRYANLAKLVLR